MLLQLVLTQNDAKFYPVPQLVGRYKAKLVAIESHDDGGNGAWALVRVHGPGLQPLVGHRTNSLMYIRFDKHTQSFYGGQGPEFILESQAGLSLTVDYIDGTAAVVDAVVITLDVERID